MTIAEGFKLFAEALGCEFTDEQSISEVLSAISKKFGGASAQTIADAAAEIAKVSDQITAIGDATLVEKTVTENGTYAATDDEANGYSSVTVNVSATPTLQPITITKNGVYTIPEGYDGYGEITVNVGS